MKKCNFVGWRDAINFVGASGVNLSLEGPQIHGNERGVVFTSPGQLSARCGAIYNNADYGITVSSGALDLSQGAEFSILNNGRPDFSTSIKLEMAKDIRLDGGHNDIVGRVPTTSGILGTLRVRAPLPVNSPRVLPATGNRWNVNDVPPNNYLWGDVNLQAFANGYAAPVVLLDRQPVGYTLCNVDPCVIPIPDGSPIFPCSLNEKVAHCATCEPVSSSFAAPDSLHLLVRRVLASQRKYDSVAGDDRAAMQRLAELLLHPLTDTTTDEQKILTVAYQELLALYASLSSDSLRAVWQQHPLLQRVIDQQIAKVEPDTALANPEFYLRLDKALAAYTANDLAAARADLAGAAPLNTPLTRAVYDYWQCFLATTQQFRDSTLSVQEYVQQLETCHQSQAVGRGYQLQTPEEYVAEQLAKQEARQAAQQAKIAALARLQLVPNPATGAVTITLADAPAGAVSLTLRDLAGRTVRAWSRTAATDRATAWTLDLAGVAPGVYVLAVGTAARTETRRLVVGAASDRP